MKMSFSKVRLKLIHLCWSNLWWNLIRLTVPRLDHLPWWSQSKPITPATITLIYGYFPSFYFHFCLFSFDLSLLLYSYIFIVILLISSIVNLKKNSLSFDEVLFLIKNEILLNSLSLLFYPLFHLYIYIYIYISVVFGPVNRSWE